MTVGTPVEAGHDSPLDPAEPGTYPHAPTGPREASGVPRALHMLSACNRMLVDAADESEWLADVCRMFVVDGGYRFAWIGYAEGTDGGPVHPVARCGAEQGFLEAVEVSWGGDPADLCPVGAAITEDRIVTVADIASLGHPHPWTGESLSRSYASVVALPLRDERGRPFGGLALYSGTVGAMSYAEFETLSELANDLAFGVRVIRDRHARKYAVAEYERALERLEKMVLDVTGLISRIMGYRDPYTSGHQQRVARLAVAVATELGMPSDDVKGLSIAAMVHDVGKIYVPAELLGRPGPLSEPETQLVRAHVEFGYEILRGVDLPWPIADFVRQHHERMDGSGYPAGLSGPDILQESRILAALDVLEAVSSHRPYRPALGIEAALGILADPEGGFDPEVVGAIQRVDRQGMLRPLLL